ncbi:NAD(P)-binding protein [Paramyrothecium foliicola]|nr:NAD(P)-binding protein [Paramyrothecium foliicola]
MSLSKNTFTCLITGANRGIGRALVAHYLARDNTSVVAVVRNPQTDTTLSLEQLPRGSGSSLIVIIGDNDSEETTRTGIRSLQDHGVKHLDLVIANAGMTQSKKSTMLEADMDELMALLRTNGLGPLVMFRETLTLLRKSETVAGPKFVNIGSILGSSTKSFIANMIGMGPQGVSKAYGLHATRLLAGEASDILTFSLCPGGVDTEAYRKMHGSGIEGHNPVTSEKAAEAVAKLVRCPISSIQDLIALGKDPS